MNWQLGRDLFPEVGLIDKAAGPTAILLRHFYKGYQIVYFDLGKCLINVLLFD